MWSSFFAFGCKKRWSWWYDNIIRSVLWILKLFVYGKIRESSLNELINEYKKRISKYANFEIIEFQDEPIPDSCSLKEAENIKKVECEKISKAIKPNDFVVSLDLTGKQLSSEELSKKIQDITLNGYSTIDFIIGGSLGLTRDFVANSNLVLSFSKVTFPHQLIRLFLAEQIFRSFKIINNEKYHH